MEDEAPKQLLIGCGHRRERYVYKPEFDAYKLPFEYGEWNDLVTLDISPAVGADIIHDLNEIPYPFPSEEFQEIHAYEVLEHCGQQGDWQFFFDQFTEFHRILQPRGRIIATVPKWDSPWAWGDPSHTRVLPLDCLVFLNQGKYEMNEAEGTPMSDFRWYYKVSFDVIACGYAETMCYFVLEKA